MFFRVKRAGSYQYLQIVHSVRQGKKVRQQVFGTLGRLDELKASGQLEALIRSGLRHCEKFALIDAHTAGETQAVTVQRIGPDLVFGRLWKECGIKEVIQSLLQARRYDFDVERAIYLTVLHRLFASGSDRAAERFGHGANHHHSRRAVDRPAGGESATLALRLSHWANCLPRETPLWSRLAHLEHPTKPIGRIQSESGALCFKQVQRRTLTSSKWLMEIQTGPVSAPIRRTSPLR